MRGYSMTDERFSQLQEDIETFVRIYTWGPRPPSPQRTEVLLERFRIPYAKERCLREQLSGLQPSLERIGSYDERTAEMSARIGELANAYGVDVEEADRQKEIEAQCMRYVRRFVFRMVAASSLQTGEGDQPYLSPQTRAFNANSAMAALEELTRAPLTEETLHEHMEELDRIYAAYLYPVHKDNRTSQEISAAIASRDAWRGGHK
jgi:hypothetical protein